MTRMEQKTLLLSICFVLRVAFLPVSLLFLLKFFVECCIVQQVFLVIPFPMLWTLYGRAHRSIACRRR